MTAAAQTKAISSGQNRPALTRQYFRRRGLPIPPGNWTDQKQVQGGSGAEDSARKTLVYPRRRADAPFFISFIYCLLYRNLLLGLPLGGHPAFSSPEVVATKGV